MSVGDELKHPIIIILLIIVITLIIITASIYAPVRDKENEEEIYNLDILINNTSEIPINITIKIIKLDSYQIFNSTFSLKPKEIQTLNNITNQNGTYLISVFVDENRYIENETIIVGKYYGYVKFRILDDEIIFFQEDEDYI